MDNQEWVRLGGTLVGGGAMGALITAAIGAHRNRIQPVGYRIVSNRILSAEFSKTSLSCKLMLYSGNRTTTFDNILMSQVLIVNKGNRDMTCFRLGLTMKAAFRAIHIEASTSDRHHVMVEASKPIDFSAPSAEIDVELKPF